MKTILEPQAVTVRTVTAVIPAVVVESDVFWEQLNQQLAGCFRTLGTEITVRWGVRGDQVYCAGARNNATVSAHWLEGDFYS